MIFSITKLLLCFYVFFSILYWAYRNFLLKAMESYDDLT